MLAYLVEPDFACPTQIAKFKLHCSRLGCACVAEVSSSEFEIDMTARHCAASDIKARFHCRTKFHLPKGQTRWIITQKKF